MGLIATLKSTRYMQYISAVTATLSMASTSVYITWASPSLPKITSPNSPIGTTVTRVEGSWIASSFMLGIILGCTLIVPVVEKYGRRTFLLLCAIPMFVPWIVVIFANSAAILIAARFAAGLASSVAMTVTPIYIGEIADKDIRGKLGVLCNLLMNTSNLFVLSVGPLVSYTVLAISSSILPLIFLVSFYFMPESPYYLIKTNQKRLARASLIKLSNNKSEENMINNRLAEIEATVDQDMKNKSTLWEFFSKQEYRKSLIILFGIGVLKNLTGLNAILSYAQTIIAASKSNISPETSSLIFGLVQVLAVLLSAILVDKMGRKPLLVISALGCAIALIAEGTYFYLDDVDDLAWLPTSALILYLGMNAVGLYTLPYVLVGELYATNIKGVAALTFIFYNAGLAFVAIKIFEPISTAWGMYTMFWIFAGLCILGAVFVVFVLPETKGKTFGEIQEKLNRKKKEHPVDVASTLI